MWIGTIYTVKKVNNVTQARVWWLMTNLDERLLCDTDADWELRYAEPKDRSKNPEPHMSDVQFESAIYFFETITVNIMKGLIKGSLPAVAYDAALNRITEEVERLDK